MISRLALLWSGLILLAGCCTAKDPYGYKWHVTSGWIHEGSSEVIKENDDVYSEKKHGSDFYMEVKRQEMPPAGAEELEKLILRPTSGFKFLSFQNDTEFNNAYANNPDIASLQFIKYMLDEQEHLKFLLGTANIHDNQIHIGIFAPVTLRKECPKIPCRCLMAIVSGSQLYPPPPGTVVIMTHEGIVHGKQN